MDRRVFLAGLACLAAGRPDTAAAQSGLIEKKESAYNTIYITREGRYVAMQFGLNESLFTESLYNPADPRELPVEYTRYMTAALAYLPRLGAMTEIGLGGGRTAQYIHLHVPEASLTCVEIDPAVIEMARKHFGLTPGPRLQVVARDGRIHLRQNRQLSDVIFVDAYRGTFVPFHLLTREFFTMAKSRLAPGGVLAQNIEPCTMLYPAAVATLEAVFQHVDLYYAAGNVVAIAYDGAARTDAALTQRAAAIDAQYRFRHPIAPMIRLRNRTQRPARGRVLTDDFAPVESLRAIDRNNADRSQKGAGRC